MKNLIVQILFALAITNTCLLSQGIWVQTQSSPEGAGITDMIVTDQGTLLVTAASYNYPTGQGGIRRSTDAGNSWVNVLNGYTARTIAAGSNGTYFASFWNYPSNEGLYVSYNDGQTWANRYLLAAGNNNIFSILPIDNNMTIFIGTRLGVHRSTDGGISFPLYNNGIPANSWVRDIALGPQGELAIATTNGAFISTNNGSLWMQATGIAPGDTIVKVKFLQIQTDSEEDKLLLGTQNGKFYESSSANTFLQCLTLYIFADDNAEISGIYTSTLGRTIIVSRYPKTEKGGGVSQSTNGGLFFNGVNGGLPDNPKVSALSEVPQFRDNREQIEMYCGLFENSQNGTKIFKRTFLIGIQQISSEIPSKYSLSQNYPNPFNPVTKLKFQMSKSVFVKITVYDALGKEIEVLVNRQLNGGTYEADWNAVNYSSGIYYYKMTAGDFSSTKKMILVK